MNLSAEAWSKVQGYAGQLQESCSVPDNRAVQTLQPIVTVTDVRKQLSSHANPKQQGSTSPQAYSTTYSSLGAAAREINLASGVTSCSARHGDVPEGIHPDTWAEIQSTAKKLDVTGIFDPQTNQLRSKMLQQIKIYKAMQAKQPQATAVRAVASGAAVNKGAESDGQLRSDTKALSSRLEALCQQVVAALPDPLSPTPAVISALANNNIDSLTSRLKRSSCNNLQQYPPQQMDRKAATLSARRPHTGQHHQAPNLQQLPASTAMLSAMNTGWAGTVDTGRTAGSSHTLAAASVAELSARTSTATEAVAAWQQQSEEFLKAGSSQSDSSYVTGNHRQQRVRQKAAVVDQNSNGCRSGTASSSRTCRSWQQQQQQCACAIQEEAAECAESAAGISSCPRQRLSRPLYKKEVTLMDCVAVLNTEDRPNTPDEDEGQESTAAAVQRRMSPAAFEAFQLTVAAAVDTHLQQYRQRTKQARQELLQRELGLDTEQPRRSAAEVANDSYTSVRTPVNSMQGAAVNAAAVGKIPTTAAAPLSVDAALLTMQQLVSLLAQRDAAPEPAPAADDDQSRVVSPLRHTLQQQQQQPPCAKAPVTKAEAATAKLAAAHTVADIIAAAVDHISAVMQESQECNLAQSVKSKVAAGRQTAEVSDPISSDVSSGNTQQLTASVNSSDTAPRTGSRDHQQPYTDSSNNHTISLPHSSPTYSAQCHSSTTPNTPSVHSASCNNPSSGASTSSISPQPALSSLTKSSSLAPPVVPGKQPGSSTATTQASSGDAFVPLSSNSSSTTANCITHRVPAGMMLSAPKLHAPTAQELAALPMPSLPALLDLSCEPAKLLHARLERVWQLLGWQAEEQMDMVLRYTSQSACTQFEVTLEAWETAAAAVLQREGILAQLAQIKTALQDLKEQQQQQQQPSGSPKASEILFGADPPLLFGLNASQIHQLLWAFLAATEQVKVAADLLRSVNQQQLKFRGVPYPPAGAVVSASQLQPMLDEVWELLGCGRV